MRLKNNPIFKRSSKTEDLGLCNKFNNPKFMGFVKEVFGGDEQKYTSHFQAKKKTSIRTNPID